MRRKFTVYGLRFSKTSFWNRMNTGFLDLAVATVLLTACGMRKISWFLRNFIRMLQQCFLPLAVCESPAGQVLYKSLWVATVLLTACGRRRRVRDSRGAKRRWGPHISSPWPKGGENKGNEVTVPTACGIETHYRRVRVLNVLLVATVPTACGIETQYHA